MIYRLKQVTLQTGLSKATLYKLIKAGDFPSQKRLGARSVGWLDTDIVAWIESRQSTKVA